MGVALSHLFSSGTVSREDMFIQTKSAKPSSCPLFSQLIRIQRFTSVDGQDTSQPLPYDHHLPIPQQVEQSFARSLSNLGLDYIDSVVLHSPLPTRDVSPLWTVRVLWLIRDKANASRLSDAGRLRQSGEGAAPRRIQHIRFGDVELDLGGGESEGRGCTEQVHRSLVVQCGKRRLMGDGR